MFVFSCCPLGALGYNVRHTVKSKIPFTTLAKIKRYHTEPLYPAQVKAVFLQHTPVFVQGLEMYQGKLYTSSGLRGHSFLRRSDLKTGRIEKQVAVGRALFSEGVTVFHHRLYQLYWTAGFGDIRNPSNFKRLGRFSVKSEGWGLTHNQRYLIMSNGSSRLLFLDPNAGFKVVKTLKVHTRWGKVNNINELLYKDHIIYANIWFVDVIAMISDKTGLVKGWIDLSSLYPNKKKLSSGCAVANGVAFDNLTRHLVVTGKCWKHLYEIALP